MEIKLLNCFSCVIPTINFQRLKILLFLSCFCYRRASSGGGGGGGGSGGQGVQTSALFRCSPNCVLKFLNQFRRNALKNQLKKQKNSSKRWTNSILLKFFNATLTSAGQKNAELIFEKVHLIRNVLIPHVILFSG